MAKCVVRFSRRAVMVATGVLAMSLVSVSCSPVPQCSDTIRCVAPAHRTWAMGDSQTQSNESHGLSWAEVLNAYLVNGAIGMGGGGWVQPSYFLQRNEAQQAAAILSWNQSGDFVVMAGVNDLVYGHTLAEMQQGVAEFDAVLAPYGSKVMVIGIIPITEDSNASARNSDRLAFNQWLQARYGAAYLDCDAGLITASGWLRPEFALVPGNIHLNALGEQALADCVAPRLPLP